MAVKLLDLIKTYEDVEKSGDFSERCDKLELVAELQNITELKYLVPLFLSGPAFAIYKQLSADTKKEYALIKQELLTAFGVNNFCAYGQLQRRIYKKGETVDVYLADLRRLVALIDQTVPEPLLKCAFVAGLPIDVATQIKSISAVEKLSLSELATRARMIMSSNGGARGVCAMRYVKRLTNDIDWSETVPSSVKSLLDEIFQKVQEQNLVRGKWDVKKTSQCTVWCDASNLALGVSLEVDGYTIEDAAWLRKEDDGAHINVAELEAALKGINLALKWKMTNVQVITDSATVYRWINSVIEDTKRPKVTGLSELIIRRRLGIIGQLIDESGLTLMIKLVPSGENKLDVLTRVPKKWLQVVACSGVVLSNTDEIEDIKKVHQDHHFGVSKTLYLAQKKLGRTIKKDIVKQVVKTCLMCNSVDPHPIKWDHGQLNVANVWERLASDITHVNGQPYLTIIDCGPSRFSLWFKLANETSDVVIKQLDNVFRKRRPPKEFLSDNGSCFTSARMKEFLQRWSVEQILSCAYKPTGNGIIERHHLPVEELYSYRSDLAGATKSTEIPQKLSDNRDCSLNPYKVGDTVYVKPVNARCFDKWKCRKVTKINSSTSVEVDGTNRHVSDLRLAHQDDIADGVHVSTRPTKESNQVDVEFSTSDLLDNIAQLNREPVDSDLDQNRDFENRPV
ncbi:uncharacterized protein [Watersipora subatra]|uniref:uncharacterized protein n=1 Tax=Watersipora subatra TaxID=2589382 RepID=UPI00355C97BA